MAAFGPISGFLFVWSQLIIIIPTANAVAALTFADYILQPIYQTCEAPYVPRVLIAASAVLILTILNCVSVKWVTRVQNVFSTGKIIALLIIIFFGIYCLCIGKQKIYFFILKRIECFLSDVFFYNLTQFNCPLILNQNMKNSAQKCFKIAKYFTY